MSKENVFLKQDNGDPLIERMFGYHIDNERLVAFLENAARESGIELVDATIDEAIAGEWGVAGLRLGNSRILSADLYVDASGFSSQLLGKTLKEPFDSFADSLFCDSAVVARWDRSVERIKPYTTAEAMQAGWCWQTDHPNSIARGYVYSSRFVSDVDAEDEFRAKNPMARKTQRLRFRSGRHNRAWVKNVVAIGNAYAFVEPLESTALHCICLTSRLLTELIVASYRHPSPSQIDLFNAHIAKRWDEVRWFLAVHFKLNTCMDTPFWRTCQADTDIGPAQRLVDHFLENGPCSWGLQQIMDTENIFGSEGYLSMFLGMKVPCKVQHAPYDSELRLWEKHVSQNLARARNGLSVEQTLSRVLSPNWQWVPDYFSHGYSERFNQVS